MDIITASISAFMLREQPFSRFGFPRWQSAAAITTLGVLTGLDPSLSTPPPEMPDAPVMPLWMALGFAVPLIWVCFLIGLFFMRYWLRRDGRWDGRGDLFNLLAAAWFLPSLLSSVMTVFGIPMVFAMPLWIFSFWVLGHALNAAIPRVSLGYGIGGLLISSLLMLLVIIVASVALGLLLVVLGVVPLPEAAPAGVTM